MDTNHFSGDRLAYLGNMLVSFKYSIEHTLSLPVSLVGLCRLHVGIPNGTSVTDQVCFDVPNLYAMQDEQLLRQ